MQVYDIEPEEFYIENLYQNEAGDYLYILRPINKITRCPYCGSSNIIGHGNAPREVRDTSTHGHRVGLKILAKRYICKDCKGTPSDSETFKTIELDANVTNRLRDVIRTESLKKPFLRIAEEFGITDTTVRRIFTDYAKALDSSRHIETPRVLGIDENHLLGNYRAVFTDIEKCILLDMINNREEVNVIKYINSLPDKNKIEVVTCDMCKAYRGAARASIPHAAVVIDRFHVVKMATGALETIRRTLRSALGKDNNRTLRRSRWLMLSNIEDLDVKDQEKLLDLFERYPQFHKPHTLKETFRSIYFNKTRKDAEEAFNRWKTEVAGYPEFEGIVATVENWRNEIFNYFDHPYTNAFTESINNMINRVAADGRGYSFEVLRLKCLFGIKPTSSGRFSFRDFDNKFD